MKYPVKIAVAHGDGIGKEIMKSCLKIFEAAKVPLEYQHVDMGKEVYLRGLSTGMTPEAKDAVEQYGILYKGPMETPKGTGVKSINVTARKVWSTFANKRVFKTLPGVNTIFAKAGIPIDITMVRENIEDTYGGIEHMQTNDVAQCRRLITRPGSEQVHDYAFKMAMNKNARRITCGHKANIMKLTDGMFLESFYNVAKKLNVVEFNNANKTQMKYDDVIVDDLAMKLVATPDVFDVVVLPNLQGDIISDLCAGLVGGLGMAPSANIGEHISIFEAVHGTAPDIAGKDKANPTALLLSGLMMLRHLQINDRADMIEKALTWTLQKGYRTADLAQAKDNVLTTTQYAEAIIQNMPPLDTSIQVPRQLSDWKPPVRPKVNIVMKTAGRKPEIEKTAGVDLFIDAPMNPVELATKLQAAVNSVEPKVKLVMLSNRGTQVWPTGSLFTECVNHYRARFELADGKKLQDGTPMLELAKCVSNSGLRVCSLEMLLEIGDKKGYSLAQGQ